MADTTDTRTCPICKQRFARGPRQVVCLVNHPPGQCCHYGETPMPFDATDTQMLAALSKMDTQALKDRLYAALKHEKSCRCGECSGGLNAVDALVAAVAALQHERDEAQNRAVEHSLGWGRASERAEAAEARVRVLEARQEAVLMLAPEAEKVLAFCNSDNRRGRMFKRLWIAEPLAERVTELCAALRVLGADTPSSGQWCDLHGCHQDDPAHAYTYPDCERHLRDATPEEESAVILLLDADTPKEDA